VRQAALPLAPGVQGRDYKLRYYQDTAVASVLSALEAHRSTLLVLPTGMGKTRVMGALAGDWPGDVLVLAHRNELITQAQKAIEALTGEQVGVEQADLRIAGHERIVVGSMLSFNEKRMGRLGEERFGLVMIDEAHHATSSTYRKILDHFSNAKVVGVTATPDRGDEEALGQVFESVAYTMDIVDGIEAGYLVPLEGRTIALDKVDLSGVETRQGDLVAGQLDLAMLEGVEGVVRKVLELAGDRCGPVFLPGVKSADIACQRFNQIRPGSAAFVHAKTPPEERVETMRRVKDGEVQYLVNVGIATEGFDWPAASMVALARPSKSRALVAQMAGRGTRTLPGVVDHLHGQERAGERRAAIAASAKPGCLLLDFVGVQGQHELGLAGIEDLLGGKYTPAEVKLAKEKREKQGGGDVRSALEAARRELQALAQRLESRVKATVREWNPFASLGLKRDRIFAEAERFGNTQPATQVQRELLRRKGVDDKELEGMTAHEATKLTAVLNVRYKKGLATLKQMKVLTRRGLAPPTNLSFIAASHAMDILARNNWKVPQDGSIQAIFERARPEDA